MNSKITLIVLSLNALVAKPTNTYYNDPSYNDASVNYPYDPIYGYSNLNPYDFIELQVDKGIDDQAAGADIKTDHTIRRPIKREYDFDNDPQFQGSRVNPETTWDALRDLGSVVSWMARL